MSHTRPLISMPNCAIAIVHSCAILANIERKSYPQLGENHNPTHTVDNTHWVDQT